MRRGADGIVSQTSENVTQYCREEVVGNGEAVPNGIPLSKIHHAAFDAHLIGIDPDRLHVSKRLLGQHDGPMLEAPAAA